MDGGNCGESDPFNPLWGEMEPAHSSNVSERELECVVKRDIRTGTVYILDALLKSLFSRQAVQNGRLALCLYPHFIRPQNSIRSEEHTSELQSR